MSASTTATPAASPATCSAASCPGSAGRGGAVRGLAQLSRPRGARDGLSPHPRRRVPGPADRRAARGPRRSRAQLSRGRAPAGGATRACAASTISAPATAASPGRCEEAGRAQRGGVHRPRADRAHPAVPARRHHGRGDRPEPARRGARGHRPAAAARRVASAGPDRSPIRIHAIRTPKSRPGKRSNTCCSPAGANPAAGSGANPHPRHLSREHPGDP